jgi:hypothetical protein
VAQPSSAGHREVRTSTSNRRIIIAKDPAGNGVEIISRQWLVILR